VEARALTTLLLAGLLLPAAARGAPPTPTEYEVKTAFLFNFAKFVEWPQAAFPDAGAPFTICVLAEGALGLQMAGTLSEKTVHDRPLAVRRLDGPGDAGGCQVVFLGPSEGGRVEKDLSALKGAPVLTVGDVEGFARRGGMIGFTLKDRRVRFDINQTPAAVAGLKISSQLLKLAETVR
jgi:hypothetical protein